MNITAIDIKDTEDNLVIEYNKNVKNTADSGDALYKQRVAATFERGKADVPEYRESLQSKEDKEQDFAEISPQDVLRVLSENVTADDLSLYEKMGFAPDEDNPETLVTVTDRIKVRMALYGENNSVCSDVDLDTLKQIYGETGIAYNIAAKLKEKGLTPADRYIEDIKNSLEKAQSITEIDKGAQSYILNNNLTLSIDNVYKAQYSEGDGISEVGRYELTGEQWKDLSLQFESMLKKSGAEVTEENLGAARWLVENRIPATADNILKTQQMDSFSNNYTEGEWVDFISDAMTAGATSGETLITGDTKGIAEEFMQTVDEATDEDLMYILKNNYTLNVRNLENTQKDSEYSKEYYLQDNSEYNSTPEEIDVKLLKAKRSLEETRLVMTSKAGVKMLINGVNIDTEPIENIVEELRRMEREYAQTVFSMTGTQADSDDAKLYSDTMEAMSRLRMTPAYVLGNVLEGKTAFNAEEINRDGAALKTKLKMAGRAYETMATLPRKDLGDSLNKAFGNIDEILGDLGMETTESDRRSVRILAYNSMPITEDNVNRIKYMDMEVNSLLDNMKPKTVVYLISEGINPLNMDIRELNDKLFDINGSINAESDMEKYSEYLWKMQQNSEINAEDRQAYIGIYRLLNMVAKGDRSVIGALVGEGAEITLNNMLRALRTENAKGMDRVVDDDTGLTEDIFFDPNSISRQLERFLDNDEKGREEAERKYSREDMSRRQRYNEQVLSKINDVISPSLLKSSSENIMDMPLDEIMRMMEQNAGYGDEEKKKYYSYYADLLRNNVQNVSEDVFEFLLDSGQNVTIENVMTAAYIMSGNTSVFDRVKRTLDSKKAGDSIKKISEMEVTEEELEAEYENLDMLVDRYVKEKLVSGGDCDAGELIGLRKSMHMIKSMGENSTYHIPVDLYGETTDIRVTIINGSSEKGKVDVDVYSEKFGKITAEFTLNGDTLDGIIAADDQSTVKFLEENMEKIEEAFEEAGYNVKGVNGEYCDNIYYGMWKGDKNASDKSVSNRKLYDTARIFIQNIKLFESA